MLVKSYSDNFNCLRLYFYTLVEYLVPPSWFHINFTTLDANLSMKYSLFMTNFVSDCPCTIAITDSFAHELI